MNFIRLIDRRNAGALVAVFTASVCISTPIFAARNKIYSCNDASGARVFQDKPCGTSLKPWERDLTDRTRWTNPVRTGAGCSVRSPSVALTWLRVDAPVNFEGGVALVLNADESGIAAAIVVEAAWPANNPSESIAPKVNANAQNLVPPFVASADASAQPSPSSKAQTSRRLELSGNIAGQAIVPDGQSEFVVDSMDDPTRMRYGYRQTSDLLRALKRAAALKFRLTLRSPEVAVISGSLELNGLEAAVDALTRCAER